MAKRNQEHARSGWRLRAAGLALIALAALGVWAIGLLIHAGAAHPPTPAECMLAAVTFLATSFGGAMLAWGPRLGDPIELSERWRPRR